MPSLSQEDITRIAEQVSLLMQLDRTHHQMGTAVEMDRIANVPDYIASVFEEAGEIGTPLSPDELYRQVNRRMSRIEAQVYLLRVEMENRADRDPARIYQDPMVIKAYGERLKSLSGVTKSFGFDPAILAHGWYPIESSAGRVHRWMRPGDLSLACVPHLGCVDQILEIEGHVLEPDQLDGLSIRAGDTRAQIIADSANPTRFTARLRLEARALSSANYLPIEFSIASFRQPSPEDPRRLGANIARFTCRPLPAPERP